MNQLSLRHGPYLFRCEAGDEPALLAAIADEAIKRREFTHLDANAVAEEMGRQAARRWIEVKSWR